MLKKILVVILLTIITKNEVNGQALSYKTKWLRYKTAHFEVFFPSYTETDSIAYRVARHLEYLYQPLSATLNGKPKRFPFILQPFSNVSNGFVSQTNRRSEFNLRPSQSHNFTGGTNWLDLLTIHEYRHVVQQTQSTVGFVNVIGAISGFGGINVLTRFVAPSWYWEGDATDIETKHSSGGRGESPDFLAYYKANLMERKKTFKYEKALYGSYRHLVPSQYPLGYLMITYMKNHYGDSIWNVVMNRAFKRAYIPGSMSLSLKHYTGKGVIAQYKSMNDSLKNVITSNQEDKHYENNFKADYKRKIAFDSYTRPFSYNHDVYYLKSGFDDASTIYKLSKDKEEKKLKLTGPFTDQDYITVSNGKAYWLEREPDLRRSRISFSNVVAYDIKSNKSKRIKKNTRYVCYAVSESGKVLTLELKKGMGYNLKVDGKLIKEIPAYQQLLYPRWSKDEQAIIAVFQRGSADEIVSIDPLEGTVKTLFKKENAWFGHPQKAGNDLIFVSNMDGIQNIYHFDLSKKILHKLTNTKYGILTPLLVGDEIIASEKRENGQHPIYLSLSEQLQNNPLDPTIPENEAITEDHEQLGYKNIPKDFLSEPDAIKLKKVSRLGARIRPNIWSLRFEQDDDPLNEDFSLDFSKTAFSISASDMLDYWKFIGSYETQFGRVNGSDVIQGAVLYDGFYPKLIGRVTRQDSKLRLPTSTGGTIIEGLFLNSIEFEANIPFTINTGRFSTSAAISASSKYVQSGLKTFKEVNSILAGNGAYGEFELEGAIYHLKRRSYRDLQSPLGVSFISNYSVSPGNHNANGNQLTFQMSGYFPGLMENHGFRIRSTLVDTQYGQGNGLSNARDLSQRQFNILFSRASGSLFPGNALAFGSRTSWINNIRYTFPLLYPDIGIGTLLYLKRMGVVLGAENATQKVIGVIVEEDMRFLGNINIENTGYLATLFFDFNVWNFESSTFRFNTTFFSRNGSDYEFNTGLIIGI